MSSTDFQQQIDQFEAHYRYDSSYMRELLEYSPEGYAKFAAFLPLARHRERLSEAVYWVSKLAAMQAADCGECLQLNVRMALEDGVAKQLIQDCLSGGEGLPAELKDIYQFSRAVALNLTPDTALVARVEAQLDRGDLLELGLSVATTALFPAVKRTLGNAKSCSLMEIEV